MIELSVDISRVVPFLSGVGLTGIREEILLAYDGLMSRKGAGREFLGWLDLPSDFPDDLLSRIQQDAERIRSRSEILVVVGIGGSYLGSRAVMEALGNPFKMLQMKGKPGNPFVLFAGQNLSGSYHKFLLELLDMYSYSVVVISKSGTTTEPAVAFRLLKDHLEKKTGKQDARQRIIAVTDSSQGALKKMADDEGYSTYVIPDDVGGRYSVLTPAGLLPVAAAGYRIEGILQGASRMEDHLKRTTMPEENPAMLYAAARNLLYRQGKRIEILVSYEPGMSCFVEWWKQLYGESEGKQHKGIFPAGAGFTTDLHSLGQFIQEGSRILFETVLSFGEPSSGGLKVPADAGNLDGLNFLSGRTLDGINRMAELGTLLAHVDGRVPNIRIRMPSLTEEAIGEMIYFFEFACALSGYTLGINPFDQPGVEAYKKNMFALLGKPGYEKESEEIRKQLD
jgi:glucose-6-phosphate isomerase